MTVGRLEDVPVERLLVLRDTAGLRALERVGPGDIGPRATDRPPAPLHLDVEEDVTADDRAEIHADPAVLASSPVMPIRLIEPAAAGAPSLGTGVAWGVVEVGAAASSYTGDGVSVAVLDTGVDSSHPAFDGVQISAQTFVGGDVHDRRGHGTHCAGTVLGRDVGGLRIGVARGVSRLFAGKVLDDDGGGTTEALFEGLLWAAAQDVQVVSMSLGFDFPGLVAEMIDAGWPPALATSAALQTYTATLRLLDTTIALIRQRETVVVAAAGNESRRDLGPRNVLTASLPAAATGVLSVAAANRTAGSQLDIGLFSNGQPRVSAPGVGITSAQPGGTLIDMDGTSMAAPHVAGVAALWWEAIRAEGLPATADTVMAKVVATARADRFVAGTGVEARGAGVVTAP